MNSSHTQYSQVQVGTSSREKLLLMLYDGAIRFTKVAIQKIEDKNVSGKGVYISKAMAIVSEFQKTLNFDECTPVAQDLDRLYSFINRQYCIANSTNSVKPLQNALKILMTLREGWAGAVAKLQEKPMAAQQ